MREQKYLKPETKIIDDCLSVMFELYREYKKSRVFQERMTVVLLV